MKKLILEELGLNHYESLAYETLLVNGEMSPPEISGHIRASRENTYHVLKTLENKGLVVKTDKGKKFSYQASSPEKLKELLELEKINLREKEKAVNAIIPELNNLYTLRSNKPSVTTFEGLKGMKLMYEDIFKGKKPEEVLVFRSPHDDDVIGKEFAKEDNKKLTLAGIKTRLISPPTPGGLFEKVGTLKINREVRFSEGKKLSIPAEICVYNNRVTVVSFRKDRISAIIESKDLADTMREIFDYIWETLDK